MAFSPAISGFAAGFQKSFQLEEGFSPSKPSSASFHAEMVKSPLPPERRPPCFQQLRRRSSFLIFSCQMLGIEFSSSELFKLMPAAFAGFRRY